MPDLEMWLNDVAVKNDEILKKDREYLYICPKTDNASQTSLAPSTQKTESSKVSSSLQSRRRVKKRKRYFLLSKGVKKLRSKMKLRSGGESKRASRERTRN